MRSRYDEMDDKDLQRHLLQLTDASNSYLGELVFGKHESAWEDTRKAFIETAIEVLRDMRIPNEEIQRIIAEDVEFDQWWEDFHKPKSDGV